MVQSENFRNVYTGNGVATTFAYGFKVENKAHLLVTRTVIATSVETTLVVDVDYTVNGVGSDNSANWTITHPISGSPMASTHRLTIVPNLPVTQLTDFENQGGFFADTHEDAVDKLTIIAQQHQEELDRSVKVTVGSTTNPATLIADLQAAAAAAAASAVTAAAAAASIGVSNGFNTTALTSGTTTRTFGTNPINQRFTGTLTGACTINLVRPSSGSGHEFRINLNSIVTTAVNTLTIQENGAGSLAVFNTANTVRSDMVFIYSGSAWVLWWEDTHLS